MITGVMASDFFFAAYACRDDAIPETRKVRIQAVIRRCFGFTGYLWKNRKTIMYSPGKGIRNSEYDCYDPFVCLVDVGFEIA